MTESNKVTAPQATTAPTANSNAPQVEECTATATKLYTVLSSGEPIIVNGMQTAYVEPVANAIKSHLEAVTQGITYSLEYSQTSETSKNNNSMPVAYLCSWDDTPTPAEIVAPHDDINTISILTEVLEYTADILHWLQMPDIELSQIAKIANTALTPVQTAIEAGKNAISESVTPTTSELLAETQKNIDDLQSLQAEYNQLKATPTTKTDLQPLFSIHHNGKPLTISGVTERQAKHIINHLEIIGSRDDVFTTEYVGSSEAKLVPKADELYCIYRHDKPIYTHQTKSLLVENDEYKPIVSYLETVTAYLVMQHLEALTDDIKYTRDGKTGSTYSIISVGGGL